jgi:hypothetical protein
MVMVCWQVARLPQASTNSQLRITVPGQVPFVMVLRIFIVTSLQVSVD